MDDEHQKHLIDHVTTPPTETSRFCRAWKIEQLGPAVVDAWIVEAAWAHPFWHSYLFSVCHLRLSPGLPHPEIFKPDATHEIIVAALDPDKPRQAAIDTGEVNYLVPINFAAQITVENDAAAAKRLHDTMKMVLRGELSPDTDFLQQWIELFGDHMVKVDF